jgi:hypothetical protein
VNILIDNQPFQASGSTQQTIRELAQEACTAIGGAGERVVVDVRCNGELVPDERLETVLETPAGRFERLEFRTRPMGTMVRAALTQAIDLFEQASGSRTHIADLLADGQKQPAMHKLQQLFESWRQVQETMLLCAGAIGVDLDQLQANGLNLANILGQIKQQLITLKDSIEAGDFVVTGDILRYELDEPFSHWIAFLQQLRKQAPAE